MLTSAVRWTDGIPIQVTKGQGSHRHCIGGWFLLQDFLHVSTQLCKVKSSCPSVEGLTDSHLTCDVGVAMFCRLGRLFHDPQRMLQGTTKQASYGASRAEQPPDQSRSHLGYMAPTAGRLAARRIGVAEPPAPHPA